MSARGKSLTLAGVTLFAGAMFALPYLLVFRSPKFQNSKDPLKAGAIQRGPYINSGSKDVGPDPDWQGGVYVGKR